MRKYKPSWSLGCLVNPNAFVTANGTPVTAVTADEMRAVDGMATETVGLGLLSMMENAGRNLASVVEARRDGEEVVVFAGGGGNGGGGLAGARHLSNRGVPTTVVLDRPPAELEGATEEQYASVAAMGLQDRTDTPAAVTGSVAVDALVGYGLSEGLDGRTAELARRCTDADTVVSLDVPSGVDATTGAVPGPAVDADATLTLALPKTGLGATAGDLRLGDIALPGVVYNRLDVPYRRPFGSRYVVPIHRVADDR